MKIFEDYKTIFNDLDELSKLARKIDKQGKLINQQNKNKQ